MAEDVRPGTPSAERPPLTLEPADLVRHGAASGEPAALLRSRLRGLEAYERAGLPQRSVHLWRYTSPVRLFPPASPLAAAPAPAREPSPAPAGGASVLLEAGRPPRVVLSDAARDAGLRVLPLGELRDVDAALGVLVAPGHGPLEALSLAAWNCGAALLVPRGTELAGPVLVTLAAGASSTAPRLVVQVGEAAGAAIIERHEGGGEGAAVLGVTELRIGAGARLAHAIVGEWVPGTRAHLTTRLVLERDATAVTTLAPLGGDLVKLDIGATLDGPGARSEIVSLVAADGHRHVDVHTEHVHRAGHTWSNVTARSALAGWSRAVYTGLIRVEEQARAAEAFQESRNLMLSESARVDTIPELEILTDEVACSHGATVAPLAAAERFYLESRGLSPRDARRLLVDGFFADAASGPVGAAVAGAVAALRLEAA